MVQVVIPDLEVEVTYELPDSRDDELGVPISYFVRGHYREAFVEAVLETVLDTRLERPLSLNQMRSKVQHRWWYEQFLSSGLDGRWEYVFCEADAPSAYPITIIDIHEVKWVEVCFPCANHLHDFCRIPKGPVPLRRTTRNGKPRWHT